MTISDLLALFDRWNNKKKDIHTNKKSIFVKERHIVFITMGQNIGYEQNGKGEEFLRPVIVYKKFNNNQFLGIPLTSQEKSGKYYFEFSYQNSKKSYAILSQLRVFDTKRVKYKSGTINLEDYEKLIIEVVKVVTPQKEESPEGIYTETIPANQKSVKS